MPDSSHHHEAQRDREFPKNFAVSPDDAGRRLDQFLVAQMPEISRARVQQLIAENQVRVNNADAKASRKLRAGEQVTVLAAAHAPALRAMAENIPLDIVYEDEDVAVVNKPAGMMVHAGAGATDGARNRGTLVNALLHRFQKLSDVSGALRPGIVHRLDRNTSGLMVVAKNDAAHRRLAEQFAAREVSKTYVALLQGWLKDDAGTISSAISRDRLRRTRMTTRRRHGRAAVSHWQVRERIDGPYGKFTLVEVKIETGRTHQIRVHMASAGHPVVGDTLYGAPHQIKQVFPSRDKRARHEAGHSAVLGRNFLHAAAIQFKHPRTGAPMRFARPLPPELQEFMARLGQSGQSSEIKVVLRPRTPK